MSRVHRPSALAVSFGEPEPVDVEPIRPPSKLVPSKRRIDDNPGRRSKLFHRPQVAYYVPPQDIQFSVESPNLVVIGEDPEDADHQTKPVRYLSEYSLYDPSHKSEMVCLSSLEIDEGDDRHFEAAGIVSPVLEDEEDEGQEDDLDGGADVLQHIRLGAVMRFSFDYTKDNDPVYIETEYAWYILRNPSPHYRPYFLYFYSPRRIAQIVVTSALREPKQPFDTFLKTFLKKADPFGRLFVEEDLAVAIPHLLEAIEDHPQKNIGNTSIVKHLLSRYKSTQPTVVGKTHKRRPPPPNFTRRDSFNRKVNIDIAVLKPENQTPTHVTPRIAALAQEYCREQLYVVGPRPNAVDEKKLSLEKEKAYKRLCQIVTRWHSKPKFLVDYRNEDRFKRGSKYVRAVQVEGEMYYVGDVVIVPIGHDPSDNSKKARSRALPGPREKIPSDKRIHDYFWFARIIYFDIDVQKAHVQWFNHGALTLLEELADPQELFLQDLCGPVDLEIIAGKVSVRCLSERPESGSVPFDEFFNMSTYDPETACFKSINTQPSLAARNETPPNNCPICLLIEEHEQKQVAMSIKDGVALHDRKFHLDDFVLYRSVDGPGDIGQIVKIDIPKRDTSMDSIRVVVRKVGRISSLAEMDVLPRDEVKDERHLFMTDDQPKNHSTISVEDLLRVIYVRVPDGRPPLEQWLSYSPDHFYLTYRFPSLEVTHWSQRRRMERRELHVCAHCVFGKRMLEMEEQKEFLEYMGKNPLNTLDLFGGVGAFGMGVEEGSGCIKVTHAVEISPSAARTFRANSPDTVVYNQCVNVVLPYFVKTYGGLSVDTPQDLGTRQALPPPPVQGEIRCIVAGFPCQSHSALNMYRRADDVKSNRILTALSFVDLLKPDYAIFENVPGFLSFNLLSVQKGQHVIEGGIDQGGLKLLVRALVDMGYQVRFGLLQAGHYGTPQGRIRFFLFAARHGVPLPELPQPTHDFPLSGRLNIELANGRKIKPIQSVRGVGLHPFVTIRDAIGDLRRWDWELSGSAVVRYTLKEKQEAKERKRKIPTAICRLGGTHWGLGGGDGQAFYEHEPFTRFQMQVRLRPPVDIQHFTRCFPLKTVERVIKIRLEAGSDYRCLPPGLFEFQFASPVSSIARQTSAPSLYGRLDAEKFFNTTVTNVSPTAKQCKVLHPFCKRILTVRELARSQGFPDHFVFEAIDDNVVTMVRSHVVLLSNTLLSPETQHRCIGNAVPWPVSVALGRELQHALLEKWRMRERIVIDD